MDNSEYYRQNAAAGGQRRTPAFCGKCGSKAAEGATRCAYCGAYLSDPDADKPTWGTSLSDSGMQQAASWNRPADRSAAYSDPAPQQAAWTPPAAPVSPQPQQPQQPQQQPWNQYNVTYNQPAHEETSVGAWFGWMILLSVLPLIGTIIMLASTKPGSTKNYAKLLLILQIIAVVLVLIVLIFYSSVFTALINELS